MSKKRPRRKQAPVEAAPMCGANTVRCEICDGHRRTHGAGSQKEHAFEAKPCEQTHLMQGGKCSQHGGKSLSGVASATFKHGRYSKVMPTRLLERFQASIANPDLLEMREELSVCDAHIAELLDQLGHDDDTLERFESAKEAFTRLQSAYKKGEAVTAAQAMTDLEAAFGGSPDTIEIWSQLDRFITLRTRVVLAESRRRKEGQEMIPIEKVWVFVAAMTEAVRRTIQDGPKMRTIQAEFRELTGRPDPTEG